MLYPYDPHEDGKLLIEEGMILSNIMGDMDDLSGWWFGTKPNGECGLFPSSYVELIPAAKVRE